MNDTIKIKLQSHWTDGCVSLA